MPTVALSLQPRRSSDYISWPFETAIVAVTGSAWWMLLRDGAPLPLGQAVSMTWAVLGLLPGKILLVRQSWPLPADRPEEHLAAQDAKRRYSVRVYDALAAFLASILWMIALPRLWPAALTDPAAQWLRIGLPLVLGVVLMIAVARDSRLHLMNRGLRPAGSWTPVFGRRRSVNRASLAWFIVWFGGILLSMCLSR